MTAVNEIKLLDHGYVKFIEAWGSDERIIESARMSTAKGFLGWGTPEEPGDEKLLRYLYEHKHSTPFEFAGLTIEVKAPIFIFRQWHRHRTQCLAPDTLVHFERRGQNGKRYVYKMRIEDVWKKWQPSVRKSRPERQTNALRKRQRIQEMSLRCLDEEGHEITSTRVVDVIRGEPKPMVRVTTASGRVITATRAHRFMTNRGWTTLGEAIDAQLMLTLEGTTRAKAQRWERPIIDESSERWRPVLGWEGLYEVSSEGRVRRLRNGQASNPKRNTPGAQGYDVVSLSRGGQTYTFTVHTLVLEAFEGPRPEGTEARHLDDNRGNPSLANLEWASPKRNAQDRVDHDRQQRLVPVFEEIVSVEDAGELPTYDLSVEGPWHNFIADGFVVHNSYNEMSARYTPLPAEDYVPTVERLMANSKTNKQAGTASGAGVLDESRAAHYRDTIRHNYLEQEEFYQDMLRDGVPKELARLVLPVGRYSVMRATANLRNWLAFLTLRMDSHAQQEIQDYAGAVGVGIMQNFPRTWDLFIEGMFDG